MELTWDDVNWDTTHIDGVDSDLEHNMIHIGTWDSDRGRLLVIRIGSDDDTKPHGTIALDIDKSHGVIMDLDMSRRSL